MCWSAEVSAVSAVAAWGVCAYLYYRNLNFDRWAAAYLLTFTLTQVVDVFLWLDEGKVGLSTCSDVNYGISKFGIPFTVFAQHFVQCQYPSKIFAKYRQQIAWAHLLPVIGMSSQFGCSKLVDTPNGISLCWGGYIAETSHIMLHVGFVMFVFYMLMPLRVGFVHNLVLGGVMTFLYQHDGTLALGSKWCSYCLIYSVAYLSSPYWIGETEDKPVSAKEMEASSPTKKTPTSKAKTKKVA